MPELKYLSIVFDGELAGHEIPAFRGAVAGKAGHGHVLFHGHEEEGGLRYSYPLIQYKRQGRKPMIICLGDGTDDIHHFFGLPDWRVRISGRQLDLKVRSMQMDMFPLELSERCEYTYQIGHWIALDQKSFAHYINLPNLQERIACLESKLVGNILSMAKGIGWQVPGRIRCEILDMPREAITTLKGIKMRCFQVRFRSNVSLPDHISLGKSASLGFGQLQRERAPQWESSLYAVNM